MSIELALVVSSREWAGNLHQFITDHGGARVRVRVLRPEDAISQSYDVFVVDDVTSFLSPRLVSKVQAEGRTVLGVFDSEEAPEGKARLEELGVDATIDANAAPEEFLRVVGSLSIAKAPNNPKVKESPVVERGVIVGVGGPSGGVGSTEIALALASLMKTDPSPVLVDADDHAPSVAQRLGLALHPNLRSAVDALLHRNDQWVSHLLRVRGQDFEVVGGLAKPGDWSEIRPQDVSDLLGQIASHPRPVVANVGADLARVPAANGADRFGVSRQVVGMADLLVAVCTQTPTSVTRLFSWVAEARGISQAPLIVAVNRSSKSRYQRAEIEREIERSVEPESIVFVPEDGAVARAVWNGEVPSMGPFMRTLQPLARACSEATETRSAA